MKFILLMLLLLITYSISSASDEPAFYQRKTVYKPASPSAQSRVLQPAGSVGSGDFKDFGKINSPDMNFTTSAATGGVISISEQAGQNDNTILDPIMSEPLNAPVNINIPNIPVVQNSEQKAANIDQDILDFTKPSNVSQKSIYSSPKLPSQPDSLIQSVPDSTKRVGAVLPTPPALKSVYTDKQGQSNNKDEASKKFLLNKDIYAARDIDITNVAPTSKLQALRAQYQRQVRKNDSYYQISFAQPFIASSRSNVDSKATNQAPLLTRGMDLGLSFGHRLYQLNQESALNLEYSINYLSHKFSKSDVGATAGLDRSLKGFTPNIRLLYYTNYSPRLNYFAGPELGYSFLTYSNTVPNVGGLTRSTGTKKYKTLSYGLLMGTTYQIGDFTELSLAYRFFLTPDYTVNNLNRGADIQKVSFSAHYLQLGVKFICRDGTNPFTCFF